MSTIRNNSDESQPKRMRLGTRSCAECRRRKVRCIFPKGSSRCEACALHNVPCYPQGSEPAGNNALKKRVDELESMLRQISDTVNVNGSSNPLAQSQTRTIGSIHEKTLIASDQNSRQQSPDAASTSHAAQWSCPSSDTLSVPETSSHPDALGEFGNTPLLKFFKDALLLQKKDGNLATNFEPQRQHPIQNHIDEILPILPPKPVLSQILETTKRYWAIWPVCFYGSVRLQDMSVIDMLDFLLAAFKSDDVGLTAKALLWIALCIFELPLSWTRHYSELSQPDALVDSLLHHARHLLALTTERGETIDSVEALILEVRLNIDLGRPRKAWLGARQAVNASLLLGIHRMRSNEHRREQAIWRLVLHLECQSCLIIGLPPSISNSNKSLLPESGYLLPLERLMHELRIIYGAAAERSQADIEENYHKTLDLDHDWEKSKRFMPSDFWDVEPPSGLSFEELYSRQTAKLQFYILGRYIHLPYLLKSTEERIFSLSRTTCLEASREIIVTYQNLRKAVGLELSPCGLMDFESFSAGMVIAINLLQERSRQNTDLGQNMLDQNLLVELIGSLHQVSTLKTCTVAGQAAIVLDKLVSVLRGDASQGTQDAQDIQDKGCDVTIPFFGRLRIKVPNSKTNLADSISVTPGSLCESLLTPLPVVEFGTMVFDQDVFANFDMGAELNANWATNGDASNYDWVTVFQQNQMMNNL